MHNLIRCLALLLLAGTLGGCQLAAGYLVTDFTLSIEPEEVAIPRGGRQEITVEVRRLLPVDASPFPITVSLHRPPAGIGLEEGEEVTIPSGIDEEVVTVVVESNAEVGTHDLVFRGSSLPKTREATLSLTVDAGP